jgi:hypothetical protein
MSSTYRRGAKDKLQMQWLGLVDHHIINGRVGLGGHAQACVQHVLTCANRMLTRENRICGDDVYIKKNTKK